MKKKLSGKKKIIIAAIALAAIAAIIAVCVLVTGNKNGNADNTIMVYMVASNLETKGGSASNDLQEMIDSEVNLKRTNVLVYAGGTTAWTNEFSSEGTNYYQLQKGDDGKLLFKKVNAKTPTENMADAPALSDFINFCTKKYPAERYGLILWDHGEGPNVGFGKDMIYFDSKKPNYMTMKETAAEMDKTIFAKEKKLDFIGYDACLMSSIEVAQTWSPYAKYMIASEELEPGPGWSYSFLSEFNKRRAETQDICKSISQSYIDYYKEQENNFFNPQLTIAVLDLAKAQNVTEKTVNLINSMQKQVDAGNDAATKAQIANVKKFGSRGNGGCGLVDLGHYANLIKNYCKPEVDELNKAIKEMVVSHSSANIENTCGLSLYDPLYDTTNSNDYNDADGDLDYGNALHAIKKKLEAKTKESKVSWDFAEVETDGENATLQLTPEQLDNAAKITYMIYIPGRFSGNDPAFSPVSAFYKAQTDKNGKVSVPLSPEVMVATTSYGGVESDDQILGVVQTETGKTHSTYTTLFTYLYNSNNSTGSTKRARVDINMTADSNGKVTVNDVSGNELDEEGNTAEAISNISVSGKSTVNVKEWTDITYIYANKLYDEKKPGLFFDDWEKTDTLMWRYLSIGDGLQFKVLKTDEVEGNEAYTAQIVVEDFQGKYHSSKMFMLNDRYTTKKAEKVEKDGFVYDVYKDHAVLKEYIGKEEKVVLPEKINGVPVTTIERQAFTPKSNEKNSDNEVTKEIVLPNTVTRLMGGAISRVKNLKKITIPNSVKVIPKGCFSGVQKIENLLIPDSVKYLEPFAFDGVEIKNLDLPKDLEYIGYGAFNAFSGDNERKENITFGKKAEGTNFKSVNKNMILSKDGKRLISGYAEEGKEVLKIPDGVEVIEKFAFASSFKEPILSEKPTDKGFLHKIEFPDSLKEIGDRAFDGLWTLTEITLPESLERIGCGAFSNYFNYDDTPVIIDKLVIPKNLKDIQDYAFDSFIIRNFEVASGNLKYKATNGRLTYKNGEQELVVSQPLVLYYDIKGKSYEDKDKIIYYDKQGKTYKLGGMLGSSLVDAKTGEEPDGIVYLNSEGYVEIISYERYDSLVNAYLSNGTVEYSTSFVEWNAEGKLVPKGYEEKTEYFDRNAKKYSKITDVPYYTKDGQIYMPIDDDNDSRIDGFVNSKTGEKIEYVTNTHISKDGYLIIVSPEYSGVDVYASLDGKYYFTPSNVTWSSVGKMLYREEEIK